MFSRILAITASIATSMGMFLVVPSAQASYYYDESYYNWPVPCYEYDRNGHCLSSGYRYRSSRRSVDPYHDDSYNYGGTDNHGYRYNDNRPVDNLYRSHFEDDCYWYYGTYRCDRSTSRNNRPCDIGTKQ